MKVLLIVIVILIFLYIFINEPKSIKQHEKEQLDKLIKQTSRWLIAAQQDKNDLIDKLTNSDNKIKILHSESSYEVRKKWMSHTETEEYKYPCVYSINRKNEIKFKWSSLISNGMFGKSKLIFASGATGFIIDKKGNYGLTQWATGIEDDKENLLNIKNVLDSEKFKNEVIKATSVSKAEINRKILKYFKKDFWKEFI